MTVPSALLAVSLGPVQGFIAASRRTRDLWFGSHLLSEVSKTAARAIAECGGHLIFPAFDTTDARLEPSNDPTATSVSNIILATLPDAVTPAAAVRQAREAAQRRWSEY